MVKVMIADVVQTWSGASTHVVVLFDEAGRLVLPIWIGALEATYLAAALGGAEVPRPLTPRFVAGVPEAGWRRCG